MSQTTEFKEYRGEMSRPFHEVHRQWVTYNQGYTECLATNRSALHKVSK